jgi:membrane-associated phospholipid phosphatase
MPPIAVPGHAAFPSGHATAAYLISGLLARVMPAAVTADLQPVPASGNTTAASLLTRLAERIARNREVLGLHYKSDSLAGQFLAQHTLDLLGLCPTAKVLLGAGAGGARHEWA